MYRLSPLLGSTLEDELRGEEVYLLTTVGRYSQCLWKHRNNTSAADMTKVALNMANNDEELKAMGAFPVMAIHDEIIIEAPKEFAEQAKERLEYLMIEAARQKVKLVPFKAEGEVMERWIKD